MKNNIPQRLESLDILRGFDLFMLVGLEVAMHQLSSAIDTPAFHSFMWCFTHVDWEGFSTWDLVMPLFMFMSGITIPFALSRYKDAKDKTLVYRRILKRVILLWIFGMMCQGNLLALNPDRIYLYSNTLQSIAMGYLISSLLFLHTRIRTQIITFVLILLSFWGAMELITIHGYGGGNYTPDGNLAEWIEREVLGRFRDGASVVNGEVVFPEWYRYTWILSSLNFGATVLTGLFAGYILKHKEWMPKKKLAYLFIIGASMVAIGWIWGIWHPVIKKLWTSSVSCLFFSFSFSNSSTKNLILSSLLNSLNSLLERLLTVATVFFNLVFSSFSLSIRASSLSAVSSCLCKQLILCSCVTYSLSLVSSWFDSI